LTDGRRLWMQWEGWFILLKRQVAELYSNCSIVRSSPEKPQLCNCLNTLKHGIYNIKQKKTHEHNSQSQWRAVLHVQTHLAWRPLQVCHQSHLHVHDHNGQLHQPSVQSTVHTDRHCVHQHQYPAQLYITSPQVTTILLQKLCWCYIAVWFND